MELTGHPFVDTGMMTLAALAAKQSVADLRFSDVKRVFGDGNQLAYDNERLKSYTMIFGVNGPLTQPAYRKAKKNRDVYLSILRRLMDVAEHEGATGVPCDITGVRTTLNFHEVCVRAFTEAQVPIPEQKWIGREWVPLGGSLGNDAQALPGASRPLHVSSLALLALQYLPIAVFLFKGKLACYQSTAYTLTQLLVNDIVENTQRRLRAGLNEIPGKGEGTRVALDFLLKRFENLQEISLQEILPDNTELLLWLFKNGKEADCEIERIPEASLRFIAEAVRAGFGSEVRALLKNDPSSGHLQLFECIRQERDYLNLYPDKTWHGASSAFYEFYQKHIFGATSLSLKIAQEVALAVLADTVNKKDACKPDFLRSPRGRSRVRRTIVAGFSLDEYDTLFPSQRHPIRVKPDGWRFLRFYLTSSKTAEKHDNAQPDSTGSIQMKTTHPKIIKIAEFYMEAKGPRRVKDVLSRMASGKIGIRWLQDRFCELAEQHEDWNLGTWDEFVNDENGNTSPYELLFQLRLYLANLYRNSQKLDEEISKRIC